MGFTPDSNEETKSSGFTPDTETVYKDETKFSKPNIVGVAGKELVSSLANTTKPGVNTNAFNPIQDMATRIISSAYQESKRPLLEASPLKGKVTQTAQSLGIDILAGSLIQTGVSTAQMSKNFLKTLPTTSDEQLVKNIVKVSKDMYNKTAQLLRPSDLAEYIGTETSHPAVVEASKIIKKSKDAESSINTINKIVGKLFTERNSMLLENNKLVQPKHTIELSKYIDDAIKNGTATETQIKAMNKVLEEEVNRFDAKKFDVLAAETKKEFFQGVSRKVYNAGGMDELTSGTQQAYTVMAKAMKEVVEEAVPSIKPINARYEGLKGAREMLSKLQKKMIENPNETLRVVSETIGRPSKPSMLAAAARQIPVVKHWGTFKQVSGQIENLNNKSNAMRAVLESRIKASALRK